MFREAGETEKQSGVCDNTVKGKRKEEYYLE